MKLKRITAFSGKQSLLVAVTAIGFLVGWLVFRRTEPIARVRLEPAYWSLNDEIDVGEEVTIPVRLQNNSNSDVWIKDFGLSCGCMRLAQANGAEMTVPTRVDAGETAELQVVVGANEVGGWTRNSVTLDCDQAGEAFRLVSVFEFYTRTGPIAEPAFVAIGGVAPTEDIVGNIGIVIASKDDQVNWERATSSDPEWLDCELQFSSKTEPRADQKKAIATISYRLHSLNFGAAYDGRIDVYEKGVDEPVVSIPVGCTTRRCPLRFDPAHLFLPADILSKPYIRRIQVSSDDGLAALVTAQSTSTWIDVSKVPFQQSQNLTLFDVRVDSLDDVDMLGEIIFRIDAMPGASFPLRVHIREGQAPPSLGE